MIGVTGHQDRPYRVLLGRRKKNPTFRGIFKRIIKLGAFVHLFFVGFFFLHCVSEACN